MRPILLLSFPSSPTGEKRSANNNPDATKSRIYYLNDKKYKKKKNSLQKKSTSPMPTLLTRLRSFACAADPSGMTNWEVTPRCELISTMDRLLVFLEWRSMIARGILAGVASLRLAQSCLEAWEKNCHDPNIFQSLKVPNGRHVPTDGGRRKFDHWPAGVRKAVGRAPAWGLVASAWRELTRQPLLDTAHTLELAGEDGFRPELRPLDPSIVARSLPGPAIGFRAHRVQRYTAQEILRNKVSNVAAKTACGGREAGSSSAPKCHAVVGLFAGRESWGNRCGIVGPPPTPHSAPAVRRCALKRTGRGQRMQEGGGITLGADQVTGTQDPFAGLQGLASNRWIGPVELGVEAQVLPEASYQIQRSSKLAMAFNDQIATAHVEPLSAIWP